MRRAAIILSAVQTAAFSGRRNVGLRLHGCRRAIAVPATAKRLIPSRERYTIGIAVLLATWCLTAGALRAADAKEP